MTSLFCDDTVPLRYTASSRSARGCGVLAALLITLVVAGCGAGSPADKQRDAEARLAKGDVDAAIVLLKAVLQSQPDLEQARSLLGRALLEKGRPSDAVVEFRKAIASSKQPAALTPWLCRALLADQQYDKTVAECGALEPPESDRRASIKTSVASAQLALGNVDKAEEQVRLALVEDPNYADALLLKAALLQRSGKLDDASAVIDTVLSKSPKNLRALLLKGEILLSQRATPADVAAAMDRALAIDPNSVQARLMAATASMNANDLEGAEQQLVELKKRHPANAQTAFLGAKLAYARRNFAEAATLMTPLIQADPNNVQLLQIMGGIDLDRGQFVDAQKSLAPALALAPGSSDIRRMLARAQLATGRSDRALATLRPMLDQNGGATDAALLALAGEAYLKAGAFAKAEQSLAAATRLDPTDIASQTYLALAKARTVGRDVTVAELTRISKSDRGTLADMALINLLQSQRKPEETLHAIDALAVKLPKSPIPDKLRGDAWLAVGDTARARVALNKAFQIDDKFVPVVAGLARLDLNDGKQADGRARFETLIKSQPRSAPVKLEFAKFLVQANAPKDDIVRQLAAAIQLAPKAVENRLLLGNYLLEQKDARAALLAAQEATTQLPDNPDVLDLLGRAQTAAGEINQAIASFNALIKHAPNSPLAHVRLAAAYLSANNVGTATTHLKRALALQPDFIPAQEALVALARSAKRNDEAMVIVKQMQRQRPDTASGFLLEAGIEASKKNYAAAAKLYGVTLKRFPLPEIAVDYHKTLMSAGDTATADQVAAEWTTGRRKSVPFIAYLGDRAMARQDYATAETMLREVLALQPANSVALNNLAWTMLQQKKSGAVAIAERAVALSPDIAGFLDTLATAQASEGHIKQALSSQMKALALAPSHPHLQLNLAKLQAEDGDKEAAKKILVALIKSTPPGVVRSEAIRVSKTLQ